MCACADSAVQREYRLDASSFGRIRTHAIGALASAQELNGILCVEDDASGGYTDLDAAVAHMDAQGVTYNVGVNPKRGAAAIEHLRTCGFEPAYGWMKFHIDVAEWSGQTDAVEETTVNVRPAAMSDGAAFALCVSEGFGMPLAGSKWLEGLPGGDDWHCMLGEVDGEPAACGALFVDGTEAWIGIGATRPQYRQRGAQNALLAARIDRAIELGATHIWTETGEQSDERPNVSYRNILRAGFSEAYLRPNFARP
jgi:GNAT superfamily N-acetyltransferase